MQFEKFPKIENIAKLQINITQKIHGTNAHILIEEVADEDNLLETPLQADEVLCGDKVYQIRAGSRNRWIFPEDDNYGFATFVRQNQQEIVEKLGPGRHDGEWAGLGINSGEGLKEKVFVLFDFWRYPPERPLPAQMTVVPVLYQGLFKTHVIEEVMEDLKTNGSKLSEGFMRPEGVVVTIAGKRFKKVFQAEETQWTKGKNKGKNKNPKPQVDYSHLCQPIRLEKLISKDERYRRDYPQTLPQIVKDYVADLIEEGQITGDEDQIKAVKKGAAGQIFAFVRSEMEQFG